MPDFIEHFEPLAQNYDVLLCDVWGVIHNGVAAFAPACDALLRFRERGGTAILITNAPRPGDAVARILDRLAVPREAYDAIISSGDTTRGIVAGRPGQRVFHLGPERDVPIFAGLDVTFAPLETADYVVCSGLFDDTIETPETYRDMLAAMRARVAVHGLRQSRHRGRARRHAGLLRRRARRCLRGARRRGALLRQAASADLRGRARPRPRRRAAAPRCRSTRVLAIGDSVRTDLKGAAAFGIDCLFVTSGIHAEEYGGRDTPEIEALDGIFAAGGVTPNAVTRGLKW